jgi:hypothetical protein
MARERHFLRTGKSLMVLRSRFIAEKNKELAFRRINSGEHGAFQFLNLGRTHLLLAVWACGSFVAI